MSKLPVVRPGDVVISGRQLRALAEENKRNRALAMQQAQMIQQLADRIQRLEAMSSAAMPGLIETMGGMPIEDKWFGDPAAAPSLQIKHKR